MQYLSLVPIVTVVVEALVGVEVAAVADHDPLVVRSVAVELEAGPGETKSG